jgi:hypothetical protein
MTDLAATGNDNGLSSGVSIYTTNIWLVTGITCLVYLFFNWYLQTQILTDQIYTYSLGRQVNPDKLASFLQGQHRTVLLSYLVVPLTLLVKVSLVSLCLLTGLLLTSLKLPFRTLMRIVLFAESAFVTSTLLRLLILAFSRNVESLGQYMSFAPLSLYSLFRPSSVPNWLTYPLQTLDIFQAGYVLLLATGLHYYMGQPFRKMLELVLMSYGLGLACCMIGFAFISISFNP